MSDNVGGVGAMLDACAVDGEEDAFWECDEGCIVWFGTRVGFIRSVNG